MSKGCQPELVEGGLASKFYIGFDKLSLTAFKLIHYQKITHMEKRKLIIYWVATALLAFGMLASGLAQIFRSKAMVELVVPLGYPLYFLYIIGTWKILGVIAILVPRFGLVKEWAYAGFFFLMTGALASHLASGDHNIKALLGPFMQTIFIILSWYFRPADRKIITVNQ